MRFISLVAVVTLLAAQPHIITSTSTYSTKYDGVSVLRVPTREITSKIDSEIQKFGLSSWIHSSRLNSFIDIPVPREIYKRFHSSINQVLKDNGVVYPVEVLDKDLGASIRREAEGLASAKELNAQGELANGAWFNDYHTYDDHVAWLDDLVAAFPHNSRIVSSGTSAEGRDLKGVNIFGFRGPNAQPSVIWHGNVHAREWITSMTVEYLAYSLLNNYANSTEIKNYVDKYDFYIFPIVNPDGFIYSQTSERFWRKSRQKPPTGYDEPECYGRDLNRNWNVSWAQPIGGSHNPCHEDYRGDSASDSPEISGLSNFLADRAASPSGAAMFIDWHSFSQLVMYPYGYDCAKNASDGVELGHLASGFADAVRKVYQTNYTAGPSCATLYPTSGASLDYAYDVLKIKYSFLVELRDKGQNNFLIPTSQIRPTGLPQE
ncbi:putative carboxypeptidase [Panaeolus papilionaceus]|nr:putative carboxypeptidase [Panaeolus papilionaceus]